MKHKHAEVIKAWADGAEIEYRFIYAISGECSNWIKFADEIWQNSDSVEYRIKPVTNHERVVFLKLKFTIEKKDELMVFTNVELLNE